MVQESFKSPMRNEKNTTPSVYTVASYICFSASNHAQDIPSPFACSWITLNYIKLLGH